MRLSLEEFARQYNLLSAKADNPGITASERAMILKEIANLWQKEGFPIIARSWDEKARQCYPWIVY